MLRWPKGARLSFAFVLRFDFLIAEGRVRDLGRVDWIFTRGCSFSFGEDLTVDRTACGGRMGRGGITWRGREGKDADAEIDDSEERLGSRQAEQP